MKRFLSTTALVLTLLSVSGCDFLRTLAGRPTSQEIQLKADMIAQHQIALRNAAVADSIARAIQLEQERKAAEEDSISAAKESFRASVDVPVRALSAIAGTPLPKLQYKYYLLVGSFATQEKLQEKIKQVQDAGYAVQLIPIKKRNLTAVGVCPSDDLDQALLRYLEVKSLKFCPKDAYIISYE